MDLSGFEPVVLNQPYFFLDNGFTDRRREREPKEIFKTYSMTSVKSQSCEPSSQKSEPDRLFIPFWHSGGAMDQWTVGRALHPEVSGARFCTISSGWWICTHRSFGYEPNEILLLQPATKNLLCLASVKLAPRRSQNSGVPKSLNRQTKASLDPISKNLALLSGVTTAPERSLQRHSKISLRPIHHLYSDPTEN